MVVSCSVFLPAVYLDRQRRQSPDNRLFWQQLVQADVVLAAARARVVVLGARVHDETVWADLNKLYALTEDFVQTPPGESKERAQSATYKGDPLFQATDLQIALNKRIGKLLREPQPHS